MARLSCAIIDAFASAAFQGNPAAVVLVASPLSDGLMQRIAAEFNLSETAFVIGFDRAAVRPAVQIRWFTPQCEVSFCGHATLGAVHALRHRSTGTWTAIELDCAAGHLSVQVEEPSGGGGALYWLSMPPPGLETPDLPVEPLLAALGLSARLVPGGPIWRTRDGDLIVFVRDAAEVRAATPDMAALERFSRAHRLRGVLVSATAGGEPGIACTSRFFAPAAGLPEDPVTGSAHGPLATLLIQNGAVAPALPNEWAFRCEQRPANGRVGTVHVRCARRGTELALAIGGHCVTVVDGELAI